MKITLVFFGWIVLFTMENITGNTKFLEECKRRLPNIDLEDFAKIINLNPELSKDAMCFKACILEMEGIICTEGHIREEGLRNLADKHGIPIENLDAFKKFVMECDTREGDVGDKCQYVHEMSLCIAKDMIE